MSRVSDTTKTRTLAVDGTAEKYLADGSIEHDFADGHHEVIDKNGDMEVDDLNSDKDSYCEEVDFTDAEGKVHHVKKWHHHSMDHFKEHGHKYGIGTTVVALALGLGLGLGLAVAVASQVNAGAQQQAALAASAGTTLEPVSVVPAKGDSSSRRRRLMDKGSLLGTDSLNAFFDSLASPRLARTNMKNSKNGYLRHSKALRATIPAALPLNSDYHMQPDPEYTVRDPSVEVANQVNMIGCYIGQLRGRDVGVSLEDGNPNPGRLPYVAMVDGSLCESGGEDGMASMQKWVVQATGPQGGDGTYNTRFMFEMPMGPGFSALLKGELTNTIVNSEAITSQLVYNMGNGMMMGYIYTDRSDPTKVIVKHVEQSQMGSRRLLDGSAGISMRKARPRSLSGVSRAVKPTSHIVAKSAAAKKEMTGATEIKKKLSRTRAAAMSSTKRGRQGDHMHLQNTVTIYLAAEFDSTEGATGPLGTAITDNGSGTQYKVAFSDAAILREEVGGDTVCVDFSAANSMAIGLDYVLFDAADGSRSLFSSGAVVQKDVSGTTYGAYVSNWGAFLFDKEYDQSGNDITPDWLVDGATVEKMGYSSSGDSQYTVKVANGRMTNVKNLRVPLSDLKEVQFSVRVGDSVTRKISWDGTQLVTTQTVQEFCLMWDESWDSWTWLKDDPVDWNDCQCFDPDTSAPITSGSPPCYSCDRRQKLQSLSSPTAFVPSAEEFSDGIEVETESLWGKVNLEYEKVQTLYMWYGGSYTAGDTVTQASTGASGTVFTSTPVVVKGFSCTGYTCITYTEGWRSDCGTFPTSTGSGLPKGVVLTQGAVVATLLEDCWDLTWDGLQVEYTSGSAFDFLTDITVSYPSTAPAAGTWLSHYSDIAGTLTKPGTISFSEYNVGIKQGECSITNNYVQVDVTNGGPNAAIGIWFDSSGYQYAFVADGHGASGCSPGSIEVADSDITTALDDAGLTCTSNPVITPYCDASAVAQSYQLKVKLSGDTQFANNNDWPVPAGVDIVVDSASAGPAGWVQSSSGDVQAITGATTVTFRVEKTVNAGSTVPELLCYENCPDPTSNNMESCQTYGTSNDCYYARPTHLSDHAQRDSEGTCWATSDLSTGNTLPSGTFANIGGSPAATITWDVMKDSTDTYFQHTPEVTITDRGKVCSSSSNTPTFVLNDVNSVCQASGTASPGTGTMATFTIYCDEGTDVNDFRQAHLYDFDADTGVLTEKASNLPAEISASNPNYNDPTSYNSAHFGPFVPTDTTSKNKLLCDWNSDLVCIWQAFEELDNVYFYQSGYHGRRYTLVDSSGDSVNFQSSLNLLYTHTGTTSNSGKSYDGSTSLLSYNGPGQLTGLPIFCLNQVNGTVADVCVPEGGTDSTVNGFDINIDPTVVLYDTDRKGYYAKPQLVEEIYQVAGDSSNALCSGLSLPSSSYGVTVPVLTDHYQDPSSIANTFPTETELTAPGSFLYDGEPAVIAGSTLKELEEAAIAFDGETAQCTYEFRIKNIKAYIYIYISNQLSHARMAFLTIWAVILLHLYPNRRSILFEYCAFE